jgi:hypothetical protein
LYELLVSAADGQYISPYVEELLWATPPIKKEAKKMGTKRQKRRGRGRIPMTPKERAERKRLAKKARSKLTKEEMDALRKEKEYQF